MKRVVKTASLAFMLCACIVLACSVQSRAFNEQDLNTIRHTSNCPRCNLSGAPT